MAVEQTEVSLSKAASVDGLIDPGHGHFAIFFLYCKTHARTYCRFSQPFKLIILYPSFALPTTGAFLSCRYMNFGFISLRFEHAYCMPSFAARTSCGWSFTKSHGRSEIDST